MIKIERIANGVEDEIDRLAEGLTTKDLLEFERILAQQFIATQEAVHVITGSLKSSGKMSSSGSKTHWEGTITYGGPSEGIHNPVDYAEYERERGNYHDFLAPAEDSSNDYISAINAFFGG